MGRVEDNKRDKRERILRAGRELFSAHGFEGTTMDAVAERAGVSKGAVFFHAESKAGLLNRVFEVDFRAWADEAFADVMDGHVLDQLVRAYSVMLHAMCAQPELTRIYMRAAGADVHGRDGVEGAMALLLDHTARVLDDAKTTRQLKTSVDTAQLAYNLWALYFVEQHRWLLDTPDDPAVASDRLRAVFGLQLVGLLRPGAARDAAAGAGTSRTAYRPDRRTAEAV